MVLDEGDVAEDFVLSAHDGTTVELGSYKNKKNVVLCFYTKNILFGCPSKKVFDMAKSVISVYPEIESTDTALFAISIDNVDSQAKFVEEYGVPYIHLSDTEKNTCKKYPGLNIAGLGKRSTFVIDKEGVIRRVFRDIDVKSHGQEIVDFLKQL
jgi:peroxiredoxin Q/BCP